jgi:hypothetical protein
MERSNKEWLVPLTGVAFVVVLIAGFAVGGEPPEASDGAEEVVEFYDDNKGQVQGGAGLTVIAGTLLIFFAGYLRKVLRAAEGEGHMLSLVAFVGAGIVATGFAIDATLSYAMAEAAEDVEPVAVLSLQALWDNDFFPLALGVQVLLLASGISIVRHGALAAWLGWVAIVFGVIAVTPIGFVSAMFAALWIAVVSIMLTMRARGEGRPATPAPPTP